MTQFFDLKYKAFHAWTYTVAIDVLQNNLIAVDASGEVVPAEDATAVSVIGWAKTDAAAGEIVEGRWGIFAMDNDTTVPVTAADVGQVATVGTTAGAENTTIGGPAGAGLPVGKIFALDGQGQVWVSTL